MTREEMKDRAGDPLSRYGQLMSLPDVIEATGLYANEAMDLMRNAETVYVEGRVRFYKEDLRRACAERGIQL